MSNPPPRLPLPEPPFDAALAERLVRLMPVRSALPPLALFRLLATDAPLSEAMRTMGAFQLRHAPGEASSITPRDREIVILRSCARCDCVYEWGVHVTAYGQRVGLSAEQIQATLATGCDHPVWSAPDRALLQLVDELHNTARVSDSAWAALQSFWSDSQCLHLLTLVGWYHLIAFICNGARLSPEPWAARPVALAT